MEDKLNLLLASYTLEELMEENDVTDYIVVDWMVRKGLIKLEDYFEYEE